MMLRVAFHSGEVVGPIGPAHLRSVVFHETLLSSEDIWQILEMFLVVPTRGCEGVVTGV